MVDSPFRWNITNRRYLGSLVEGEKAATYDCFLNELLECCSHVLALANDSDLIFVGRSPENIFDHLSGLLYETSWAGRLELVQFSMRFQREAEIRTRYPKALFALRGYLRSLRLSPS